MAAAVVGTAFVRIRALTSGLNKDIEKAVSKAVKDADFSKASEAFGKSFSSNASKEINEGLQESVEKTDIDGSKPGAKMGRSFSESAAKEINDSLEKTLSKADFSATDSGAGTRFGKETGERFTAALDDHLKAYKKLKLDPGIARNTAKDFDALFTKEEDSVGNTFTRVFSRAFDKATPSITKKSGASGQKAAKSFGDHLVRHLKTAVARLIPILTPTIASIVSFIVQYIVALGGQIALLLQAAAGGAVALGAAGASVGLAILPLIAAFKVKSKELDRFKASGEAVGKAWREFGRSTQRTLLPALSRSLQMTKRLIPVFSDYGAAIGDIVGRNTELLAQLVTGEEGQRRFAEIFEGSTPIVENFMGIVIDLGDILSNLFIDALPVARQFAFLLSVMVERWRAVVQAGSDNGTISATFQDWFDKAKLVFGALGDITSAIGNIISIGGEGAVPFFERFDTFAANFRTFTESAEGENKIRQIFADAYEVAHSFNLLVIDIVERIAGGIFEEGGNEGLVTFFDTLRLKIVPLIDDALRPLIEDLGPQLTDFFVAFTDVLLAMGESGALEVTVGVLTLFADAVNAILSIPGVDKVAGIILGIAGALGALNLIGITGLASSIGGFVLSLAGFTGLVGGAGSVLATFTSTLASGGLVAAIGAVVAPIAAVVAVIAAIIGVIVLLIVHWDKVKAAFDAVVRFVKDPMKRFTQLKENIEDLLGSLKELGGRVLGIVGRALARFGGFIKEKMEDAIGEVLGFFRDLPGNIAEALGALGSALLGAFGDAFAFVGRNIIGAIGIFVRALVTVLVAQFVLIPLTIGKALVTVFTEAFAFLVQNLPAILEAVYTFLRELPGKIFDTLVGLGETLIQAFDAAFDAVTSWLVKTALPAVITFFTELPGKIWDALTDLGKRLLEAFVTAYTTLTNWLTQTAIPGILTFFKELPGKVVTALNEFGGKLLGAFKSAWNVAADWVKFTAWPNFRDWVKSLPGRVATAAIGMFNGIIDAMKAAVRAVAEAWNRIDLKITIPDIKGVPNRGESFDIVPDVTVPFTALGGIFSRATTRIIGEDGAEVVIPLTKPKRALELFFQSGLADILARARPDNGGITPRRSTTSSVGGMPLVQNIYTLDPVRAAGEAARRHSALRVAHTLR